MKRVVERERNKTYYRRLDWLSDGRLDSSYYDTLASEARLASFVAIATGRIPAEHWFKLGRSLTQSGGSRALLSWSASMFEYLMPLLVMRTYAGTLLHETYHAIVQRHIQYGERRGVPWGISESAYNAQDLDGNYQYRAFGVPGLGLKRGLADALVIAPYASFLAAPLAPAEVLDNLDRFRAAGLDGKYGFYEAIDYTAERLPADHVGGLPLPTYMAHHQGMSLVAVDNVVNDSPMQRRFHADPRVRAAELLLQEKAPRDILISTVRTEAAERGVVDVAEHPDTRLVLNPAQALRATNMSDPMAKSTSPTPTALSGTTRRGKYTLVTRFWLPTTLLPADVSDPEKKVHISMPA